MDVALHNGVVWNPGTCCRLSQLQLNNTGWPYSTWAAQKHTLVADRGAAKAFSSLCFRRLPQVKWQWRYNFELVETLSSPTWLYVSFPPSLRYASDELRDDMDIALIAVKSNGLALDQAGRVEGLLSPSLEGKWLIYHSHYWHHRYQYCFNYKLAWNDGKCRILCVCVCHSWGVFEKEK